MKKLKDLDKNHPFYSKEAIIEWGRRTRKLEKEEIELVRQNRKHYKERSIDGNSEAHEVID